MKKRLFPLTTSGGGGGSQAKLITKTVVENGEYRAESEQADGFSVVTVAVPEPILKTKSITENGSYAASGDEADGFSNVVVNVPIPQPTLISKSITANGSYSASGDSADGYSNVTVAVPENFEKYHIVATNVNGVVNLAITDYVDQATDNYYVGTIVENGAQNLYILTEDGEPVILVPKTITANGTYMPASDNADGYSSVTVNYDTSPKFKVEYVDMDGELFAPVQEVATGGQATEPSEIPYFDTDYLEFVEWKASADTTDVQEDIFCLPYYQTKYDETTQQRPTYLMCYFNASYLSPTFVFGSYSTTNFVNAYIDFGDGTSQAIDSGSISHTYESAGNYVVKVWGDKYIIGGNSTAGMFSLADYNRCLYKAYIGENGKIGVNSFKNNYALTYFVCPLSENKVYSQDLSRTFEATNLSILIAPKNTYNSSYIFTRCHAKYILLDTTYSSNGLGTYCFQSCNYLKRVNTKNFYINAYCFNNCYRLEQIDLHGTTSIDSSVFNGCYHLKKLVIPSNVTNLNIGTWYCEEIIFESRQTPLTIVAFSGMINLKELIFPDRAITNSAIGVGGGNTYLENVYLPLEVYFNISMPLKAYNITVANGYAHSLAMTECNTQSVLRVAQALADLTYETAQTLKLSSYMGHEVYVNMTYVDTYGVPISEGGIVDESETLLEYITNKNWTVTF